MQISVTRTGSLQLMMLPAGEAPPFGRDIAKSYTKVADWQAKMRQVKGNFSYNRDGFFHDRVDIRRLQGNP